MVGLPAPEQTAPGSLGRQGPGLRLAARSLTASVAGTGSPLRPAGEPTPKP